MTFPLRKMRGVEKSNLIYAQRRAYAPDCGRLGMRRVWFVRALVPRGTSIPLAEWSENPHAALPKMPSTFERLRVKYAG